MLILIPIYLGIAYYLSSWLKRHFSLSASLPSIRLTLFAPVLFFLIVLLFHRSLPRNLVFSIDYSLGLLGCFSICWATLALIGDMLLSLMRRSRPNFYLGRNTCYSLIIIAGVALYPIHSIVAPFLANVKHKEALFHLSTQNWNGAIKDYDTALLFFHSNGVFYYNRGLAYLYKGETDKALADASEAVRLGGTSEFDARMLRAGICLRQQNFKDAVVDYTQALLLKENGEAYLYRAYAHLLNSDYENAINDSSKFISSAPNYPDGYEIRGLAYRKRAFASKDPPDHNDMQAAIWDILRMCDLGKDAACIVLNVTNDINFNYALYDATRLPSFIESYKNGINAIQTELAKSSALPPDKLDTVTLDSAPRKVVFLADYAGRVRSIPRKKLNMIVSTAKSDGQKNFVSQYKKEINITSEGTELWLPIQQNLLGPLKKEITNNGKVFFYAVVIGAIGDETVLLATEFKTIRLNGTPFLENNEKAEKYILGPQSGARFPASFSRPAIQK